MAKTSRCPLCGRFVSDKVVKNWHDEKAELVKSRDYYRQQMDAWQRRYIEAASEAELLTEELFRRKRRSLWERIFNR